ncbi:MAG: NADH-quinone oxidoreductase subunit NuoG [Mariprofundaceae bacterium]|nr:NADH-quinone oxidoreductase subunit NuoG [Mariprofundaceae bacterium]
MTTLFINDQEVSVPANTSILEACRQHDVDVPYFCYHPELKVAANCRMCLVEIEMNGKRLPNPVASCCTPVNEGMKVRTQTDMLKKDRKMIMEYLLIHHPLDCPVCDQGGDCKLQDYTMEHSTSHGRYLEPKRRTEDKNLGPFVSTCMTRCIHCTRCVRFAEEVSGTGDMGVLNRGDHMRIDSIVEGCLSSELSGNLAELCPVGALLDKPSNNQSRPWELTRHHSTCTQCPQGCDIIIESRDDEVIRIKHDPNGAEAWICDRGRFVYDAFRSNDRLLSPRIAGNDTDWATAIKKSVGILKGKRVGIIFSPFWSVEGLTAIRLMHDAVMHDAQVAFDLHRRDIRAFAFEEGMAMSSAAIEAADEVVILGSDLRQRLPMLMQRLRRRVNKGQTLTRIGAMNYRTNTKLNKDALIRPRDWPAVIASAMQQLMGINKGATGMEAWLKNITDRHEAGKLLADALLADSCALLVGEEIRAHDDAAALIHGIDLLMRATGHGEAGSDGRNLIPEGMNASVLSAVFGDVRVSAGDLLQAAERGELDALMLIGSDPLGDGLFPMEARRVLGKIPLVQVGAIAGEIAKFADVQLPAASYAEVDGTFINMEGVVRMADKPLRSLGEERPLWKVMMRLTDAMGASKTPVVSLPELRTEATRFLPSLADVFAGKIDANWRMPVARNKHATVLPVNVRPVMALDIVSRFSLYREGAWARASALLCEAGKLFCMADVLVHPQTLKDLGLDEGACVIRTASGEYTHHIGVRDDVAQGVLFIAKRGAAGDLSSESVANMRRV